MSLSDEERRAIVLYRIEKAYSALDDISFRQGSDYDDFIDATEEDVRRYLPRVEELIEKIVSLVSCSQTRQIS